MENKEIPTSNSKINQLHKLMNDPVFLGEQGITSTSANYLANLAQELIVKDREYLDSATFYSSTIDIVGTESNPKPRTVGKNDVFVEEIPNILNRIAKMNAFCSWMREAIKAKEALLDSVESTSMGTWGKPIPTIPTQKVYSLEDVITSLDIKERYEYLYLEAYASTYGKSIHPGGSFSKARKDAHRRSVNPIETEGMGANTVIYTYSLSADLDLVDSVFESTQNTQRQYEARLNAIKFKLQEQLSKMNLQAKEEYESALAEYNSAYNSMLADFQTWRISEKQRISKLKIRIPNELQETFEYLNSVGSQGD